MRVQIAFTNLDINLPIGNPTRILILYQLGKNVRYYFKSQHFIQIWTIDPLDKNVSFFILIFHSNFQILYLLAEMYMIFLNLYIWFEFDVQIRWVKSVIFKKYQYLMKAFS